MKKLYGLLVIVFIVPALFSSCHAQTPKTGNSNDSIQFKVQELKELYFKATNSPDNSDMYKQQFFNAFPNSFEELNKLYGYNDSRNDDNEHTPIIQDKDALNQIRNLFKNLDDVVGDTVYYRKLISISIGGYWEADAINYFQHGLREHVLAKPKLVECLLSKMQDKQIKSFWYFYFDSPHPDKLVPDKLLVIKETNTRIYSLMEDALKGVQQSWKDK